VIPGRARSQGAPGPGRTWRQVASPNPGTVNDLNGVGATSRRDAWAVGTAVSGTRRTLILHWNGTRWAKVASPNPGGSGQDHFLESVAASSSRRAVAVGSFGRILAHKNLIMAWNGHRWKTVPSPNLGSTNDLIGVGAGSAGNAWAVGTANFMPSMAVALHCC